MGKEDVPTTSPPPCEPGQPCDAAKADKKPCAEPGCEGKQDTPCPAAEAAKEAAKQKKEEKKKEKKKEDKEEKKKEDGKAKDITSTKMTDPSQPGELELWVEDKIGMPGDKIKIGGSEVT